MPVAGKTGTSSATMDVWFTGYTSRWILTSWLGDDRRDRPLGYKDAAFMLSVPMAARFLWQVTGGEGLQDVPWQRPPGVKPNDTGGTLRTTMEEVKADDEASASLAGHAPSSRLRVSLIRFFPGMRGQRRWRIETLRQRR